MTPNPYISGTPRGARTWMVPGQHALDAHRNLTGNYNLIVPIQLVLGKTGTTVPHFV